MFARGVRKIRDSYANITLENSPNPSSVYIRLFKHRKKVFYCYYKITFPKKKAKLFIYGTDKIEIVTSCKVLYTSFVCAISSCFAKNMLSRLYRFFWLKMSAELKKK